MTSPSAHTNERQAHADLHRPWLMLALVVLSFLGLSFATLLLPHDPYVRYQQLSPTLHFRTVWSYERLAFDDTPIDIAIIGNSRLQSGIAAPVLQQRLRERIGQDVHVANLSMPQEGRNAHYVMAQQLFKHHPEVKLVLLSAIEAMPRESHPAFRNIAEAPTVVTAPILINKTYLDDLAFVPFRQISLTVQSLFPSAFGIRKFRQQDYFGTNFDTTRSFVSPTAGFVDMNRTNTVQDLRPAARARVQSITPQILPDALAPAEFAIERRYTAAIANLAMANGSAIGFVYLPIFENVAPLAQEQYYSALGPVLTADCVADQAAMYSDYGHLNTSGAHRLSRMMGDALVLSGWKLEKPGSTLRPAIIELCKQGDLGPPTL